MSLREKMAKYAISESARGGVGGEVEATPDEVKKDFAWLMTFEGNRTPSTEIWLEAKTYKNAKGEERESVCLAYVHETHGDSFSSLYVNKALATALKPFAGDVRAKLQELVDAEKVHLVKYEETGKNIVHLAMASEAKKPTRPSATAVQEPSASGAY